MTVPGVGKGFCDRASIYQIGLFYFDVAVPSSYNKVTVETKLFLRVGSDFPSRRSVARQRGVERFTQYFADLVSLELRGWGNVYSK